VRRSPLIILALALPPTVFSLSSAIQYFQALCDIPVRTWSLLQTGKATACVCCCFLLQFGQLQHMELLWCRHPLLHIRILPPGHECSSSGFQLHQIRYLYVALMWHSCIKCCILALLTDARM